MNLRFWQHFDPAVFGGRLYHLLRRWGLPCLLALAAGLWFDSRYALGLNTTQSLPPSLFLIERNAMPAKGELVAFRWPGGGPYAKDSTFIKLIAGIPGDDVTKQDGEYFVNCRPVGRAKATSRQGNALQPGPTGTLPAHSYYVRAPHPDSLDSRYALTGWVSRTQIIGRAHALF